LGFADHTPEEYIVVHTPQAGLFANHIGAGVNQKA